MFRILHLTHNPLQVFYKSKTPSALYAREKWLHQAKASTFKKDFGETVDALFSGQGANGSWDNSLLRTVHKLFGLHLTVRHKNKQIEKALEWLLSQEVFSEKADALRETSKKVIARDVKNLPFSHGCFKHFAKCAILFLAAIFGKECDARIIREYELLRAMGEKNGGKWCTWSCSSNFLRAFVVHPGYKESRAVKLFVSRLAALQRADGSWPIPVPFYQTVNALGHLNFALSDNLFRRTFPRLREKQNRDGTWGKTQKEWHTFLLVHALNRKSYLLPKKMQGAP